MHKMTKYLCKLTFGYSGGIARMGKVVELDDKEAKFFNKHKAIGLYLADDDEAPDDLPPKPKAKRRTGKPQAPKTLDNSQLMDVDPKAV